MGIVETALTSLFLGFLILLLWMSVIEDATWKSGAVLFVGATALAFTAIMSPKGTTLHTAAIGIYAALLVSLLAALVILFILESWHAVFGKK